jgi:hypothetical protein
MPTKVFVPRLGEGVEEVTITKWLKAVGDPVNELEALLEVNTDKVDTEIPAPASGVLLQILLAEGVEAKVGMCWQSSGRRGNQYPVSSCQWAVSSIQYPVGSIQYPVTSCQWLVKQRRKSRTNHPTIQPSNLQHQKTSALFLPSLPESPLKTESTFRRSGARA